jgi:hypothetical protein
MKISLLVPEVNLRTTARPRACPHCKNSILHRHGTVQKPIKGEGPGGLPDEDAHPGAVKQMVQAALAPEETGAGDGRNEQRLGACYRQEQGEYKTMRGYKSEGGMKNGIGL